MKKLSILFFIFFTNVFYGQSVRFTIQNDSISNKVLFKTLDNTVVKTVHVKEANFDADLDVDEGYYLLQKDTDELLIYLKRSDELNINFNTENFYNTLVFTGKGAERNTYLLNKQLNLIDKNGRKLNYHKKEFYKGSENDYLDRVDAYYKNFFGSLFSNGYDKKFVDEEMKNLQYGYSLDLLKFEDAKKHYKFNDSIKVSSNFLEPLNYTHFDKSELAKHYNSYKKLAILKWKKDIKNSSNSKMMQEVYSSIRTESIQQGVLESLYHDMSRDNSNTKNYYNLIKANTDDFLLIARAKSKYKDIRQVVAQKKLSKFIFKNISRERVTLADYKGNYIFISFWLPNCNVCIETFKKIEKLKAKYKKDNIVFVAVALAKNDEFDNWKEVVEKNALLDKQFFYDGSKQSIVKEYNISSLPNHAIISLKGEVIKTNIENPTSEATKKLIKKLLKED